MGRKFIFYEKVWSCFEFDIMKTEVGLYQTEKWNCGDLLQFKKKHNIKPPSATVSNNIIILHNSQNSLLKFSLENETETSQSNIQIAYYQNKIFVPILNTKHEEEISSSYGIILSIKENHASPAPLLSLFPYFNHTSQYYNNRVFKILLGSTIVELWSVWLPRINLAFEIYNHKI